MPVLCQPSNNYTVLAGTDRNPKSVLGHHDIFYSRCAKLQRKIDKNTLASIIMSQNEKERVFSKSSHHTLLPVILLPHITW